MDLGSASSKTSTSPLDLNDIIELIKESEVIKFYGGFQGGISYHGHPTDQLKSLMQKAVRRGYLDTALYCAFEFDSFNYVNGAKSMVTNGMNRLILMVSEDVGIGGPRLAAKIKELYDIYETNRMNMEAKCCLADIVTLLCLSSKARSVSHIMNVFTNEDHVAIVKKKYPEIYVDIGNSYDKDADTSDYLKPDNELGDGIPSKTVRGFKESDTYRKLTKIFKGLVTCMEQTDPRYFYWIGMLVNNPEYKNHVKTVWKLLYDYALPRLIPSIKALEHWYRTKKSENMVPFLNANLCVLYQYELDLKRPVKYRSTEEEVLEMMTRHYTREPLDIEHDFWYALDRHTKPGKRDPIRKFRKYFALDGARVNNEVKLPLVDSQYLEAYFYVKDVEDKHDFMTTMEQVVEREGLEMDDVISELRPPTRLEDIVRLDDEEETFDFPEIEIMKESDKPIPDYLVFDGSPFPSDGSSLGLESEVMHDVLRVNVTTKAPTYFAVFKYDGYEENVFVKGPIKTDIEYQPLVDELKPLFGLNKIGVRIIKMVPDLFTRNGVPAEGHGKADVPLGKSNEVKTFYLMHDQSTGVATYPSKNGVVIKEKLPMPPITRWNSDPETEGVMEQYVDMLLFRQMIATSDTNNTNLVVFPDRIGKSNPFLSVDENYKEFNGDRLYRANPGKKYDKMVTKYLKENDKYITKKLKRWVMISQSGEFGEKCDKFKRGQKYCEEFRHNIEEMLKIQKSTGFNLG